MPTDIVVRRRVVAARSTAHLVNLLFEGNLEERLREWRGEGVSYEQIVVRVNDEVRRIADELDAPTVTFTYRTIYRWCVDVYGIE